MRREKIAIFEEIDSTFYPIVKKYLNEGFTVYFFEIDDKIKKSKIKKNIEAKKIINVSELIFEFDLFHWAAFYAHENVDYIFNKYYSTAPSIKLMGNLLKFSKIEDMYKKEILLQLGKLYDFELKINEIVKNNKKFDEIHFIPFTNFKIHTDKKSLLKPNIKIIQIKNFRIRFKKTLSLGVPIYRFLKKVKKISNDKRRPEFKVGIMVDHPQNIFLMNYYFMESLLIDDEELSKENVLFIDNAGKVNLKEYKKRGYNYTRIFSDKEIISWDLFLNKIIKCFLPTWLKSIFLSFFEEPLINDTNYKILSDYIPWTIFTDNYNIKNYIKKMLPDSISKTHILSRTNTKTWFCYPDCTSSEFHLDWDEKEKNQTLFSFLYDDNVVIYGDIIKRYVKKHRNFIKEYNKVGILFSQIVYEIQNGKLESLLPEIMKKKNVSGKIIGVFDTTFTDRGPIKIKDGIKFGNDILKLLEDFPEIGVIFKAKKELELTPFLIQIYEQLKNHDRCIFVARYDKEGISAPEVIAQSDLVISAAYTSTTGEALGAKKKAIYYDVAGHDIGDKYYFNRFPNFVAHSYEELKKLIHYWLYEVTDEDFEDFLNNYVKDEMDPYLDGKALTRLRKLLME